jgi:heme oxygenase
MPGHTHTHTHTHTQTSIFIGIEDGVGWIYVAQGRNHGPAFVSKLMNNVSENLGDSFDSMTNCKLLGKNSAA